MLRRSLLLTILLAVVGIYSVAEGQFDPMPREQIFLDEKIDLERYGSKDSLHARMLDSLRVAVFEIYPPELLDSARWDEAIARTKDTVLTEGREERRSFRYRLEDLLKNQLGPEAGIQYYQTTHGEPSATEILIACDKAFHSQWLPDSLGEVVTCDIGGWIGLADSAFDFALEAIHEAKGIMIDLRNFEAFSDDDASAVAGRFLDRDQVQFQVKIRERRTREYRDTTITVNPRGPWQYAEPLVMLMDSSSEWPAPAVMMALASRSATEIVGGHPVRLAGILSVKVILPAGTVVWIPSAMVVDSVGQPIRMIEPDIWVEPIETEELKHTIRNMGLARLRELCGEVSR